MQLPLRGPFLCPPSTGVTHIGRVFPSRVDGISVPGRRHFRPGSKAFLHQDSFTSFAMLHTHTHTHTPCIIIPTCIHRRRDRRALPPALSHRDIFIRDNLFATTHHHETFLSAVRVDSIGARAARNGTGVVLWAAYSRDKSGSSECCQKLFPKRQARSRRDDPRH